LTGDGRVMPAAEGAEELFAAKAFALALFNLRFALAGNGEHLALKR